MKSEQQDSSSYRKLFLNRIFHLSYFFRFLYDELIKKVFFYLRATLVAHAKSINK